MNSLLYMLAAIFAMLPAPFLFKGNVSLPLRSASIAIVLLADEIFVWLLTLKDFPPGEILPFRMLALTLCVATLFLGKRRRLFESFATGLWIWLEFFGMLSLSYRGVEFRLAPLLILLSAFLPIHLLHPYKRETRFLLAVIWTAAWIFSYSPSF